MTDKHECVFLFDVDDTLLNNDHVERDLRHHLSTFLSPQARERYFQIFEELRQELGYADYLGTLERYRLEALHDPRVLKMSCWLVDYPFAQRLYPNALDAVEHGLFLGLATEVIVAGRDGIRHIMRKAEERSNG